MARVLVACEYSGRVRDAFLAAGHDAMSCDLLPTEVEGPHYQGDVRDVLTAGWDLLVAHPPCTYLSASGVHWNETNYGRAACTLHALEFVRTLMRSPIKRLAIENPVSVISSHFGEPTQIVQPYEYGHDASKATCLWLKNLEPLKPTGRILPRMVNGQPRWGNQTDSGQNKLGPSEDRWKERSRTFEGIAQAMADQWGPLLSWPADLFDQKEFAA